MLQFTQCMQQIIQNYINFLYLAQEMFQWDVKEILILKKTQPNTNLA